MKFNTINDDRFCEFMNRLNHELRSSFVKITYERRLIVMDNNASIHKTKKIKLLEKK